MKPLVYKKRERRAAPPRLPKAKMHVTKGDLVAVISGDDQGKRGEHGLFPETFPVFRFHENKDYQSNTQKSRSSPDGQIHIGGPCVRELGATRFELGPAPSGSSPDGQIRINAAVPRWS